MDGGRCDNLCFYNNAFFPSSFIFVFVRKTGVLNKD